MWFLAFVLGFGLGVVVGVALSQRRPDPPAAPPETLQPVSFDELVPEFDEAAVAHAAFLRELYQTYTNSHIKGGG